VNPDTAARLLGDALREAIRELAPLPADERRRRRRRKFRELGVYT
jgi:acetyl-CoA carboxylase alpha subunit